jgi:poly-gamma-glutamate capsule biosynthesis protein CapA/YwtB (metallophosphatase superfamily)
MVRVGLLGDTMLGRKVGERLAHDPPSALVSPELVEVVREADLVVANLECCISERGEPWPNPTKPFFFRAPPQAVDVLALLGVDCVTLANNHALDFGVDALLDTLGYLHTAGIRAVGAGADVQSARAPAVLEHDGFRLGVVGLADHHRYFAAGRTTPGIAFADLRRGFDRWIGNSVRDATGRADAVLVTPHWGPNRVPEPVPHVRHAAEALRDTGATLVAGHSAHVFHGIDGPVLYDLGDFLDDYKVDLDLRNDLGLVWLVDLEPTGPVRLEAVPIHLDYCETGFARGNQARWIGERLEAACAEFGTEVREDGGRLVVTW